jgi:hypothetical protein
MAQVTKGHYRQIEPIFVVPLEDTVGVCSALKQVISSGNPSSPKTLGSDKMLEYADVKSWGEFGRGARFWVIKRTEGQFQIVGQRKHRPRGWEDDPEQTVIFPPDATVDDLCNRMIAILQAKAFPSKSVRAN